MSRGLDEREEKHTVGLEGVLPELPRSLKLLLGQGAVGPLDARLLLLKG